MMLSWSDVGGDSTTSRLNSNGSFLLLFGGYGLDKDERSRLKALVDGRDEG